MNVLKKHYLIILFILCLACKNEKQQAISEAIKPSENLVEDAEGFSLQTYSGYKILKVQTPWPDAENAFTYLLYSEKEDIPENAEYDVALQVPVKNLVVTSTTHIPALEALNVSEKLIGFPGLDYISSEKTRKLIDSGNITEIGQNENLNTEVLINLDPAVVVGFAINASNKNLETVSKTGIPVIYNGDWTETTPLGKAEWIKFFGALFQKDSLAAETYNSIKTAYLQAEELAKTADDRPKVIGGSMFNDQWYMPYGNSWQAQFIKDANADYLYAETTGEGSLSLAFESVLEKSQDADFWVSTGQFKTYQDLADQSPHYSQFKAVQEKNVYSVSLATGATGGVIFYELGPQRPDLVLKDLIHIFHPSLLKNYETVFFKPLSE
ncbi:MAG: ABC transporter substrate-binding protein [Gramella sp.]|nr:ABC transporter substrate-binding protein [Christiangramia sp.]